jgi:GntR family transcriptional repressor for pyruvate dehydrogenase complex
MIKDMLPYGVLQYIVQEGLQTRDGPDSHKLPAIGDLAQELQVSRGKLREEMIAAQAYGAVEMRPGDGTYVRPFDFYAPIRTLVLYSIAGDRANFDRYYRLRARIEIGFWEEAARALGPGDYDLLYSILDRAQAKLEGTRVEIPHEEHREFHLHIYDRLENPFVLGLLRAYWDAYEAVGLHRYFDLSYYERMWSWHRDMVDAIAAGDYLRGQETLIRHFTLLEDRLQTNH